MSYDSLSATCGLKVAELRRLVRHAMTNHIFQEHDNMVSHTAASKILAQNTAVRDLVGIQTEELFPGAPKVCFR